MNDVLVLGAGPAGSTAAHLLARAGLRVTALERAVFPRFHIGESLLPCDLPIFDRLGFAPAADAYLYKAGAEFFVEATGEHAEHPFAKGLPGTPDHAYQVERARFDADLAGLAAAAGATIRFGERVRQVDVGDDGVRVETEGGDVLTGRYLIDATGQDAFLGRRRRTIEPIRGFGVVASFCHFTDLRPDAVAELEATGNIKILLIDEGWAWLIPLVGGRLSFGVVSRKRGVGTRLLEEVAEGSPLVRRLTAGATRSDPRQVRHFAYFNREAYGARFACVGDAATFLDPCFSSGVSLGMLGAERVADRLAEGFAAGDEGAADLMHPVKAAMRHGYVVFGSLIRGFYHRGLARHFLLHADPQPDLHAGLISILAGDVWREDNAFQTSLVSGRRLWTPEDELRDAPVDDEAARSAVTERVLPW